MHHTFYLKVHVHRQYSKLFKYLPGKGGGGRGVRVVGGDPRWHGDEAATAVYKHFDTSPSLIFVSTRYYFPSLNYPYRCSDLSWENLFNCLTCFEYDFTEVVLVIIFGLS